MRPLTRATLVAALVMLIAALAAPTAGASIGTSRVANIESGDALDQISAQGCDGDTAAASTDHAYTGTQSLKVHYNDFESTCNDYARGIFNQNSPNHLVTGDDFWVGAAIYLPAGFWAAHTGYTDLMRVDSYVDDSGNLNTDSLRQYITLAAFSDDTLWFRAAATTGGTNDFVGPLPSSALPEGQWNWVEMHIKLSPTNGAAVNELKINGVSKGTSTLANQFAGRADYNRVRYGLVSANEGPTVFSGNLTAYVDRMSIRSTELGPLGAAPSYSQTVLGTAGLVSYWRLGEASGTTAADSKGTNNGTYLNSPTLGAPGLIAGDPNTAVHFDGTNDYVNVSFSSSLNASSAVSLEEWIKPDALTGSVLKRNNSYELRVQSDGRVLWRIWVAGVQTNLETNAGDIVAGQRYHLVGTYDGSAMRVYRNGALLASTPVTGTLSNSTDPLTIGVNSFDNTFFTGVIDEAAIYNTALSASTVSAHYAAGG